MFVVLFGNLLISLFLIELFQVFLIIKKQIIIWNLLNFFPFDYNLERFFLLRRTAWGSTFGVPKWTKSEDHFISIFCFCFYSWGLGNHEKWTPKNKQKYLFVRPTDCWWKMIPMVPAFRQWKLFIFSERSRRRTALIWGSFLGRLKCQFL